MNRMFKKSLALIALVGALTGFSSSQAQAAYFTGGVGIIGGAGFDATEVNVGVAIIGSTAGSFTVIPDLTVVTHADPIQYNPFPVGGYSPLWSEAGSGFSFHLLTLAVVPNPNPAILNLAGTGVFKDANGILQDTNGIWVMSVDQFKAVGTFSSASIVPPAVPEPASLALLGLGLAGVAAVRRRKKA